MLITPSCYTTEPDCTDIILGQIEKDGITITGPDGTKYNRYYYIYYIALFTLFSQCV